MSNLSVYCWDCRRCFEPNNKVDLYVQEVEMEHDGVSFSFIEKFYRCPECGGMVFSKELVHENIDRANEAYQRKRKE